MIRIGLIGAGNVGRAHAETFRHLPGVKLAAVADSHPANAKAVADAYKADALTESQALIERDDIDVVVIASPTPFHAFQARNAAQAGKHVYLETPVARTLKDGREAVEAARQSGVVMTVGHTLRCYSEYEGMRARVQGGAIGTPGVIRLSRRTPHPRGWYANIAASGGAILDGMIHELDYLLWTFGPVERIYCRGLYGRRELDRLDYALAVLRMKSGAIAHVETSWCHYGQFCLDAEFAGDKGLIRYDNLGAVSLQISLIDFNSNGRSYFSESPIIKPAHFLMMEKFLAAVKGEGDNPAPAEEALEALALVEAAAKSMELNQAVQTGAAA
ncbi:MAG: gfo/Idh/MocA family oxidoreductase [bacterium]|nr:gfo/Idh/MocA family oxidoreductase [bacterium]